MVKGKINVTDPMILLVQLETGVHTISLTKGQSIEVLRLVAKLCDNDVSVSEEPLEGVEIYNANQSD